MNMRAKTAAERRAASDSRYKEKGYKGRKVWATPEEHTKLRDFLLGLRGERK